MTTFKVSIKSTNTPTILKFEVNEFITDHQSFEFHNIDEAKDSPLAQQLFYLPFVKKVFISMNFVAIERYNIVDWPDVQVEVAEQIAAFLNQGGSVVNPTEKPKKTPVSIYAESTPNPNVLKFVCNKKLVENSLEFNTIDETVQAPLATALFQFSFVKSVFLDYNYISVKKYDIADWDSITMELREFIRKYIEQGNPVLTDSSQINQDNAAKQTARTPQSLSQTEQQIVDILEEYVKPAVASDGGNIQFDSYSTETQTVKVILQGACSGCPSSTMTLKSGIENMLRQMMPEEVMYVEALNG